MEARAKELIAQLGDKDWHVRGNAAFYLGEIAEKNPESKEILEAVPALIDALGDRHQIVRKNTVWALGEIKDATAVPALITVLGDEDPDVRLNSALALGKIADPSAIPALIEALGDEDSGVRFRAAEALEEIKPRNYNDLKLLHSASRKARNEGRPTKRYVKLYNEWSKELGKDADQYVSAAKNLPKPRVLRKSDSIERVQLKRVVG